ncbi:hypothetical protein Taro_053698 [Colocasia esculenta]|uniref:Uncharacterized protein n=1 Tax=Colocasia esculenta TaxID=4460 RepID=A0A843XLU7_COLES|nr:hypothetical protein [Colocasia esculenta]
MMTVLQMQIQQIVVKFDYMSEEVQQMKDLLLQLVCQQGTSNSPIPPAQPEQQHQQQPEPNKDQAVESEKQQSALEVQPPEQQLEQSDQVLDPQVKTFKRRVMRELMKSGQLVFPSPPLTIPSPPIDQTPLPASDPTPPPVTEDTTTPPPATEQPSPPPPQPIPSISTSPPPSTSQPKIDLPVNTSISSFAPKYHFKTLVTFNEERFKLGLPDVNEGQWRMILQGNRPIIPSMTIGLPSELHPSLVGAISSKKQFAQLVLNRHIKIAAKFKVKYNIKLSFHGFVVMYAPKSPQHMKEFQHCFAESKRLNKDEWVAAYPEQSAVCRKLKLSHVVYLLKVYDNLWKSVSEKWIQRYIIYYQAKDAAHSQGLHWNVTIHDFLSLAVKKQFVPLRRTLLVDHHYIRDSAGIIAGMLSLIGKCLP